MKRADPVTRGAATIYNGKLYRVDRQQHHRTRHEDREKGLETEVRRLARRVLRHQRANRRQGRRDFRHGRRRIHDARIPGRLGSGDRQEALATYTIPAPGEPGSETWPKNSDAWKVGGGPTWRSGSYDRSSISSTGAWQPGPYDPRPREQMDSLYTSSVLAIRRRQASWSAITSTRRTALRRGRRRRTCPRRSPSQQPAPQGDDPAEQERLLVPGRPHELQADRGAPVRQGELGHAHRSGDGSSRAERRLQAVPRRRGGRDWPSRGNNAVPIAFNPNTGLVYATTWNLPRIQKLGPPQPTVIGGSTTGVVSRLPPTKPGACSASSRPSTP